MTRPGFDINLVDTAPSRGGGLDVGAMFTAAGTERGPTAPQRCDSMGDFTRIFGGRVSQSMGYDCVEAAFRSGLGTCWFSRVVGPAAVIAGLQLLGPGATVVCTVSANGPGTWGNAIDVVVTAGVLNAAARVITVTLVTDEVGTIVESSPECLTREDLDAWADGTQLCRIALGVNTGLPVAVVGDMTGGTDDIANENDAAFQTAIDRLSGVHGPGQVVASGRTSTAAIATIANHAAANRRCAIGDLANTPTAGTLLTAAATHRGLASARWLSLCAPWVVIPGATPGTTRTIPFSSIEAALIAVSDRSSVPAKAVCGQAGASFYASDVTQTYTAGERTTLSAAGVNVVRLINGVVEQYDYVSVANPDALLAWKSFGSARTAMLILFECETIGEMFFGSLLDGKRKTLHAFGGAIEAVLKVLWDRDALYGENPGDAYRVEVDSVNSPTTLANLELHAEAAFRVSPFAQWVVVNVSNVPITLGV